MLDPEGFVIEWNTGAERIKGYTAEEIIGQHFLRFYTPEDRAAGKPQRALAVAVTQGKYVEEGWRMRKNGERFLAEVLLAPLRNQAGDLVGFAKITRDVDERRKQRDVLAQYQKMDALGQLTGGIAHDFNNLLHVIQNATTLLERRLSGADQQVHAYIEMLKRNAERGTSLTQRLLAYARRQMLDPQPVNPAALLPEATLLLRQALGEAIDIETVVGAGVWWIHADAHHLETAILNLALNSRDAMSGRGKLTIEISNAFLDESYASQHSEVMPGQYVMIAVSDTGTGMDRSVLVKAFDPFFTTKEVGKGTGLGLSQVYGFTKQSGGHATIYSEPGQGTTVKMYLPRHAAPAASGESSARQLSVGGDRETILVVEDDEDVRGFTVEILGGAGYRVLTSGDAAEALRTLEHEPKTQLLFTDVGLPGDMNGRELADEAVRRVPSLKVLFTTGYARNAIFHHGRLDPGVALVTKPFSESQLTQKVAAVLAATPHV